MFGLGEGSVWWGRGWGVALWLSVLLDRLGGREGEGREVGIVWELLCICN